jgi:hypothetical protein
VTRCSGACISEELLLCFQSRSQLVNLFLRSFCILLVLYSFRLIIYGKEFNNLVNLSYFIVLLGKALLSAKR